ncbi:MAG TPA: ATP-dependent metallopeptidase FtsH/Yme1/Tma family protein, partial [Rudaea sp.]
MVKNLLLWVVIAVVLITVIQSFNPRGGQTTEVSYSDFMQQVENNAVSQVTIGSNLPSPITG